MRTTSTSASFSFLAAPMPAKPPPRITTRRGAAPVDNASREECRMRTRAAVPAERRSAAAGGERPADVFVIFWITGDLAKVMTFRSLYRLERRGLLDCPIVGVAVDDWTVEQLVERARESIVGTGESLDEDVFKRLADRFSYVS